MSRKKSLISNDYWERLEEEKQRQLEENGFYRKSNWSDEFVNGNNDRNVNVPKINDEGLYDLEG